MNPEKIINSFVEVVKTRSDLFSEKATEALKPLEKTIVAANNESNQAISDILSDWCKDYPEIRVAVKEAARNKVKPKRSQPQGDENILENHFPRQFTRLLESLEKRLEADQTPKN